MEQKAKRWSKVRKSMFFTVSILFWTPYSMAAGTDPSGVYYSGSGVVWSGDIVSSPSSTRNYAGCTRSGMGIVLYNKQSTTANWGTDASSGRVGIVLGNDVILSLTGMARFDNLQPVQNTPTGENITGGVNFSSSGVVNTGTTGYNVSNTDNAYLRYAVSSDNLDAVEGTVATSASVVAELYLGPNAEPGTYNVGEIQLNLFCGAISLYPVTTNAQFTVVKPTMTCSVATPPIIDFGIINIMGVRTDSILATQENTLQIDCTAPKTGMTTDIKIMFKGNYYRDYWGQLQVVDSKNEDMAYIRGQYASGVSSCGIIKELEIGFSGNDNGSKIVNNVGEGITSVPLSWSLCKKSVNLFGVGTAQATAIIEWE